MFILITEKIGWRGAKYGAGQHLGGNHSPAPPLSTTPTDYFQIHRLFSTKNRNEQNFIPYYSMCLRNVSVITSQ